jgi:phage terminase large subunit
MRFDESKCEAGLAALGWYHEKQDEHRDIGLGPDHDWSSHSADAFGLGCIVHAEPPPQRQKAERPRVSGLGGWMQ